MKKICVIVFFIFLGTQLIPAQTLTVHSPAAGVTWYKGETKTISWTKSGCPDPNIRINIFRNFIDPANFVEQLTCTGCSSKSWTIPGSYTSGNYQIRVKTDDNACVGDSVLFKIGEKLSALPVSFEITEKLSALTMSVVTQKQLQQSDFVPGNIQVTKPAAGSAHPVGVPIIVKWNPNFDNYGSVNIAVCNSDNITIAGYSAPNSGTYSWTPQSLYNNKNLYVVIMGGVLYRGISGNFHIVEAQ